jgi:hypothetical protein
MIVYSDGVLCAFDLLRTPPVCVVGLLFAPGSCGWDLLQSPTQAQPVVASPWPVTSYPSSYYGSLCLLALRLSVLFFPGPFFISWALGFSLAVFLPALPLLILFFLAISG